MNYILRLQNVVHQYNGKTVLDIPALNIPRGSITGLAGPNGSGKSTMLRILSCVERCSSGSIFFEDNSILPFDKRARHFLTYLPQEPYLLKRSVFDNISYGLKIRGTTNQIRSSVSRALELVGLSAQFANRLWYELSGGEAQRVALASRLVLKPSCLMLDEPTASVDMESARNIRRAILLAQEEWGTTLVISSHQQSWLNDICDQIVYLYNGNLLDYSYKNVLFGPWENYDSDLFSMKLKDGQLVFVSKPPASNSSGVIPAHAIQIKSSQPTKLEQNISGVVTGIFTYKNSGSLNVHVVCGDQEFIVELSESDLLKERILPNQKVFLVYHPTDFVWLP